MTDLNAEQGSSTLTSDSDVRVAFWNVQNLFDVEISSIAAELEYTPVCGWDRNAFDVKIRNVAEVIRSMFDGNGPDLLGLCEVENERVARHLLREIGRPDYQLAIPVQPAGHALDTVLIYSDRHFEIEASRTRGHVVHQRFPTNDILEVHLTLKSSGADIMVLVNHWPSRRPDRRDTEAFRVTAASSCRQIVHSYLRLGRREYLDLQDSQVSLFHLNDLWNRNILIMGDLNDEPWSTSVKSSLGAEFSLEAMHESIEMTRNSLPSWKMYSNRAAALFNPVWSLIQPDQGTAYSGESSHSAILRDQMILSRGLCLGMQGLKLRPASGLPEVRILRPKIMTSQTNRPIAFRLDNHTGYSDHFPIAATLQIATPDRGAAIHEKSPAH